MNKSKLEKIKFAKQVFDERGIIYKELSNGHLKVDNVNFWATTEKWHDPKTGVKGQGINSFIHYLKDNKII